MRQRNSYSCLSSYLVKSKRLHCNLGTVAGLESVEVVPIQVVKILALVRRSHLADKTLHIEKGRIQQLCI
jgi:hypothetical protein